MLTHVYVMVLRAPEYPPRHFRTKSGKDAQAHKEEDIKASHPVAHTTSTRSDNGIALVSTVEAGATVLAIFWSTAQLVSI